MHRNRNPHINSFTAKHNSQGRRMPNINSNNRNLSSNYCPVKIYDQTYSCGRSTWQAVPCNTQFSQDYFSAENADFNSFGEINNAATQLHSNINSSVTYGRRLFYTRDPRIKAKLLSIKNKQNSVCMSNLNHIFGVQTYPLENIEMLPHSESINNPDKIFNNYYVMVNVPENRPYFVNDPPMKKIESNTMSNIENHAQQFINQNSQTNYIQNYNLENPNMNLCEEYRNFMEQDNSFITSDNQYRYTNEQLYKNDNMCVSCESASRTFFPEMSNHENNVYNSIDVENYIENNFRMTSVQENNSNITMKSYSPVRQSRSQSLEKEFHNRSNLNDRSSFQKWNYEGIFLHDKERIRLRSKSRSVSKSRSRSRSRSHSRRSRSRSKSRRSRSRSRSRRSRSRSRSRRSRSRSRSRRSRSRSRSRRSRSRSKSRRSRSRSKSRRSRSRSKSRRSRSRSRSRRSRSRSGSRTHSSIIRNRKHRSKSRSREKDRSRSKSTERNKSGSRKRETNVSPESKSLFNYRNSRSRYRGTINKEGIYKSGTVRGSPSWDRSTLRRYASNNDKHDKELFKPAFSRQTGRKNLIKKWRMNNCNTQDEMHKRLTEISLMNPDEILEEENKVWIRSAPADRYYVRDKNDLKVMRATPKLDELCQKFQYELVDRGNRARAAQTLECPLPPKPRRKLCNHMCQSYSSSDDSDSEDLNYESDTINEMMEELQRKQQHPYRLHRELWFNDPGEMNDGPLCRCSAKAKRSGIRHGFYAGEENNISCDLKTNNAGDLYHYRITISPPTNFLTGSPSIINHDDHEFIFEGFSLISHYPIQKLPVCKVIRFNIEYIILYVEEQLPDNFTIEELDLFHHYLFKEILELLDFDLKNSKYPNSCPQFHFMPRFVRELPDNGRELLPMCEVLKYLLDSNKKLIEDDFLDKIPKLSNLEWQHFADNIKGMVVTIPGMKPCSLRVDQLDREIDDLKNSTDVQTSNVKSEMKNDEELKNKKFLSVHEANNNKIGANTCESISTTCAKEDDSLNLDKKPSSFGQAKSKRYPEIVHFGIRPPQLSYAGNPEYQKAWREYVKFRHLLANMPKPTTEDKQKLAAKENQLQSMRSHSKMKRDVTITVSSQGFYLTGLMCDVVQHAMLIPVLVCHLRFHRSLCILEKKIGYNFKNRFLLQLALTHPSYRENFGTNPDHARNSLANCGIRQPEYGDRRIHYMNTRKRGINTLISIMSRFGKKNETESNIYHNERLEFLGDAVVEFITSIHLFHIFRDLEEGGLATYRAALVQNQHLSVLAKRLQLHEFMLYAHGTDLCHDLELKHAMANCFEALMGALFLDGGIEVAGKVFGETLYGDDRDCLDIWFNYEPHPLQEQEPLGDRRWIPQFPFLQKLTEFEESIGIEFKHIRLLARAFTDRSMGYTNLTLGSNQRLEFLGDSVLQLIASDYLYKYFPEHHEGHLSLLRSSLVNNKTQAVVCDDLGMTSYAVYANPKIEMKIKDRADLLEAFLAALCVDQGLETCRVFCNVCFFPRLQDFIMNQDWNDPKSKLQQCCLTQRTMDGGEPDIPIYKVVECKGPTNTRVYTVAVYFRDKRLAEATGHSIQQAEMNAAQKAMEISGSLFPQLDYQKRVIAKSLKTQKWPNRNVCSAQAITNAEFNDDDYKNTSCEKSNSSGKEKFLTAVEMNEK